MLISIIDLEIELINNLLEARFTHSTDIEIELYLLISEFPLKTCLEIKMLSRYNNYAFMTEIYKINTDHSVQCSP